MSSCRSVLGAGGCTGFTLWPFVLQGNDSCYWEGSAELGDETPGEVPLANFGSNKAPNQGHSSDPLPSCLFKIGS